jgi:hypothetical protein
LKNNKSLFLVFAISLFLMSGFMSFSYANEIVDCNGNPIKTGKKYYIAPWFDKSRGLTYESCRRWDYIRLAKKNSKEATAVKIYLSKEKNKDDLTLTSGDKIAIKMCSSNYSGYEYLKSPNSGGWVYLDNNPSYFRLDQEGSKKTVSFQVGSTTRYFDKYGRPHDKWFSDYSVTDETFFTWERAVGIFIDHSKLWVGARQRFHPYAWDPSVKAPAPAYYLVPAE